MTNQGARFLALTGLKPQQHEMDTPDVKNPNLSDLREQLGIKQDVEKPVATETPKLPNGEVDLNALAAKARENKKD